MSNNNNLERFTGGPPPRPPGGWGQGESTAALLCATYNNIGAIYHNLDDHGQSRSYLQQAVHTMMDHVVFVTPSMERRRQQIIDNEEYSGENRHSRLAAAYGEALALEQELISRYSIIAAARNNAATGTGTDEAEGGSGAVGARASGNDSSIDDTICSPIFINKETMRLSSSADIYRNSATILFNMAINFMHSLIAAEREGYANRSQRELRRIWERAQLFFHLSTEALNTGVTEVTETEQQRRRQTQQAHHDERESALFRFHTCRDSILRVLITHQQNNLEQMKARYLQMSQAP